MDQAISSSYLTNATLALVVTTGLYFVMNGAQIFETALIIPAWTAAPPASLGMFQGPYRLDFKVFWIALHSLHELTFILALVLCWRLPDVRNWLVILFVAHIAVRVWTVLYFAPTVIAFQGIPYSATIDQDLVTKAAHWRNLNYLRVGVFIAINIALVPVIFRIVRMLSSVARV
jgi:hypothetical protein